MKTILTLAANPDDTSALQLNREIRDIETLLQQSKCRDEFTFVRRDAVRWEDLQRAILELSPRIIHFCGHGAGQPGLVLEREQGQRFEVGTAVLSDLFRQEADTVECVVINACYSKAQAQAISQHINYVIGMNTAIPDDVAIAYARGFYLALGAGESIPNAHATGCREIQVQCSSQGSRRDLSMADDGEIFPTTLPAALIPELYLKTPLTPFIDAIGQSSPAKTSTKDVREGFVALVDLLSNHEIYASVTVFRSDFKLVGEQIQLLSYYKTLHDLLHKLEIECYRNIVQEARRFPSDEMALTMLAEYAMALQGILQEARRAIAARPATASDAPWVSKLDAAQQELQTAVDSLDTRPLQKAIFLFTQLLADQPVRLNASLTETAKALRLSALVTSLVTLKEKMEGIAADPAKVQQFIDGIAALSGLSIRLGIQVQAHDAWQEVDSILRRIETNLSRDTTELEWSWTDLKEKTQRLYPQNSDTEILILQQCEQKLDDAIAATDPAKIRHHFCVYRRAALNYFSLLDRSLIQLCGELRTISQSIALVVEKIS
ncbi:MULTISPECIES: CHAT domain-containing protein [Cyanophyceae]|uniref:CHAT domain-containing protein n=1 Tax=Cyanophyceae TaxID=3028117 RepID=UPI001683C12D|nr:MULTISPECIES: CHAT domain-containing protein [Cyanophyceae]MBD1916450.1 CHAT domain-containing protein [Phormidium sp. FACHB-77]MBD2029697.1 CHAT domain-containing protein [Phormidium sp. FACHB-322]MBD2049592.1 CHAT domain-containing protein [Leptolyngbya sp. FACHB-60]